MQFSSTPQHMPETFLDTVGPRTHAHITSIFRHLKTSETWKSWYLGTEL